jgi:FdhD protein
MSRGNQSPQFLRYNAGEWEKLKKNVITETPVSLTVNGQVLITLMCTPTDLEALAVGFLFNEGLLKNKQEVELIQVCTQGDNVDVWLKHPIDHPKQWRRTSGCTGGASAIILEKIQPELSNGFMLAPSTIDQLLEALNKAQVLYREVGGVHTSILSDGKKVVVSAEDVGRHNSLDKIAGHCLLDDLHPSHRILATTGRISSEMIQKAARIGASIVISRTSASSLSVDLADTWGITLIGYARRQQFVVYTHAERILQHSNVLYEYSPVEEV